jgi:hypothetical protein
MNGEGFRGGTQEANIEAAQAQAARRAEGSDADAASVCEVRRSEGTSPRVPDVRYISR